MMILPVLLAWIGAAALAFIALLAATADWRITVAALLALGALMVRS